MPIACCTSFWCVSPDAATWLPTMEPAAEVVLDSPAKGVYIPPMVWATEYKFSRDAVLMVLASDYYDAGDYIRDYTEFLALRRKP